jgi:hypothetical protein
MALSGTAAHHRAVIASIERCIKNGERQPDDPELIEARRALAEVRLTEHIERVVSSWPPLTDDQVNRIAARLRAGGV